MTDYQFNYRFIGDRQKPLILWLHGFMGNINDFLTVIDLICADYCCLVVDLPGHGQTEVKQDVNYQMPNVAWALIQLLDSLKIKECWLVGYSMGGRLGLYLTLYYPQYFKRVILESASSGLKTQLERDRRIEQDFKLADQLESQDLALFLNQWYANPLFASFVQHPNYLQAIANRLDNNPRKLAKSLRYMGLGQQPSLSNQLKSNQVSILLIVGELDPKFLAINQKIASLCPQSNLRVVKNSGHNVHFEHPLNYSKLIRCYLKH